MRLSNLVLILSLVGLLAVPVTAQFDPDAPIPGVAHRDHDDDDHDDQGNEIDDQLEGATIGDPRYRPSVDTADFQAISDQLPAAIVSDWESFGAANATDAFGRPFNLIEDGRVLSELFS